MEKKKLSLEDLKISLEGSIKESEVRLGTKIDHLDSRVSSLELNGGAMATSLNELRAKLAEVDNATRKNGVLFEHVDAKFALTLEGYVSVKKQVEELEERVERGFAEVDYRFGLVSVELNTINSRLISLETRAT
jgi:hypothetical protein